MKLTFLLQFTLVHSACALGTLVETTTGPIQGSRVAPGVLAWRGIPFATPPIKSRRWMPPVLNKWSKTINTTALGPACIQQLDKSQAATDLTQIFYNTPPLPEDEDCLSINIWAPENTSSKPKAVLFWIFGGGFASGGSGTFFYDGESVARNQDVILVSHNYRTNVFGFPNSPELPLGQQNLALLDQQLALKWTSENIAKFGGDPKKITLFGLSAGSASVALLLEHFPVNPPFHGVILQSGVIDALDNAGIAASVGDVTVWNTLASHFNCTSAPLAGASQMDCLRNVPANVLEQFTIDNGLSFGPQPDGGVTIANHPTQLLESGKVAKVPIMIGDNFQGGSFLTIGENNFTDIISQPPFDILNADELRSLYPVPSQFSSDAEAVIALATDFQYRCPNGQFADIVSNHSLAPVYRYTYGGIFPQFQFFPNAGTPEGVELPLVFGNLFNTTNATEIALSDSLQTIWANFAKNPSQPPAPHWSAYEPKDKLIANLGFTDKVALDEVVQLTNGSLVDRACSLLNTITR
ncbi:Alpha/Beta hydrolase protein [Hysterangium stoloniferum]|nr:Alpha/Beta hydrolase protein [Hysterangium stoloniferum]